MFQPLPVFVGLRYVRARTQKFFVSFITWVSLLGVCLGVAALIVILSVMNGFEGELRDRLLALSSHAQIVAVDRPSAVTARGAALNLQQWQRIADGVRRTAGVTAAAPFVELQALAVHTPDMLPVVLRGIDPQREQGVTDLAAAMREGELASLRAGDDRVIVGSEIARQLGLVLGDSLTLLIPGAAADGVPDAQLREFTVAGTFEIGLQDHDATLVLAHIADLGALAANDPRAGGVHLRFQSALDAPRMAAAVARELPPGLRVRDWTQQHASYFRAIRIEKTMMSLILMLIVAVAAFNIVAMLVMVVTDKRSDIAILRTLGASPRRVMGVFLTQGLTIGWLGVLLGVALGVGLALNVEHVVPFLERSFGFQIMDASVYYITRIPSELRWANVAGIGGAALLLTSLATVYPALRAAAVAPAEALRYE